MSRASHVTHKLLPWAGLLGGGLGAALFHQIGSDSLFTDCAGVSPGEVLAMGVLALLLLGAGAFGSWKVWSDKREGAARRLVATVSLLTSAILLFAILMPMIAALLIPPCFA